MFAHCATTSGRRRCWKRRRLPALMSRARAARSIGLLLADYRCRWCEAGTGPDLSASVPQVVTHAASPLIAMLAVSIDALTHSPALQWLD